ncbi:nucleic-acid-binding protein from transposon X-element [Trichonephila clavipes]|nr:nucleic-acid-binding protein from transposon X-element [Trichonephila clavipes]
MRELYVELASSGASPLQSFPMNNSSPMLPWSTAPAGFDCSFYELFKYAKCANCSGLHPANFSGCPKNPVNTKPNKTKPTKNVWQERAAARKQNQKQSTPSFAEIVKGTNKNSLDAKEVITQMAQMMSQWGQMMSLLQSKL